MRSRVAKISLLAWVGVLFALALGVSRIDIALPIWDLQDTGRVLDWLEHRVLLDLASLALFLPLGVLALLAIAPVPSQGRRKQVATTTAAIAFSLGVAALVDVVRTIPPVLPPTVFGLFVPVSACLLGAWIASRARRGRLGRLALELSLALTALGTITVAIARMALSEEPLGFEASRVTSEDKRRLVQLVRGKDPRKIRGDDTRTLSVTEEDTNQLLAWGLSIGSTGRKARVEFHDGKAELAVSIRLPRALLGRQYLNCVIEEEASFDGALQLATTRFEVGGLSIPRWVLAPVSSAALDELERDDHVRPLLDALRDARVTPHGISVTYGRVELPDNYAADVFARFARSEVAVAATQAYVDHLVELALGTEQPLSFGACLEAAFGLARYRSLAGDPVIENRAAVFALGILLGHRHVRTLIGPVELRGIPKTAWRRFRRVTVRGRRDWTRHFTVSAALKLLSNVATSDAVGLLKEELDAGVGGSGFSFGDLLADRAGTTFARAAIKDREAAISLQERIGQGFRVDDFFPPAADLPEGIPDPEFQRDYGGVGGKRYRELTEEIERRIATCAAYRDVVRE